MFWNKRKSNGFIIIYTLIIFSMVLTLLLYCFRIKILEKEYNESALNIQVSIDEYNKDRTYLFTKLNKYIKNSTEILNRDSINNALININNHKIEFCKSFIKYNEIDNDIVFYLHKTNNKFREEHYNYNLKEEGKSKRILFNIVKIKY